MTAIPNPHSPPVPKEIVSATLIPDCCGREKRFLRNRILFRNRIHPLLCGHSAVLSCKVAYAEPQAQLLNARSP